MLSALSIRSSPPLTLAKAVHKRRPLQQRRELLVSLKKKQPGWV
jgi:hypothetical protein